ncbi:hypothetical protein [Limosilactobacillus reuteri]|nr:hypothetical protein [Limosilactobacillus reuteri]
MGTLIVKGVASLAIPIMVSVYFVTQKDVNSATLLCACAWEWCVVHVVN